MSSFKHYHHHYHFSYTTSFRRHFSSFAAVLALVIIILLLVFRYLIPSEPLNLKQLSAFSLVTASLFTLYRLTIAYVFSLVLSVPLALVITASPRLERILLPIFDIVQSVPVLAFFPVVVLVFLRLNFFDGAAIFVLFMAMLWNLVFTMIGGLKTTPQDIKAAATIFGAKSVKKLFYVTLPSIFPYIITGSMLAWAQAWNIVIVAEVLHTYIPGGDSSRDLIGLGSLLVNATSQGKQGIFLASLIVMIILIGALNLFIWQRLLHLTERYKYD